MGYSTNSGKSKKIILHIHDFQILIDALASIVDYDLIHGAQDVRKIHLKIVKQLASQRPNSIFHLTHSKNKKNKG